MSNPSLTHSNPYIQGGWDAENSWPNDGSFVPGSPRSASWVPAQTAYGVLPLAATPGALPPGLLGAPITFRFMASGNQTNLAFVGPNYRACYRIRTTATHSVISVPQGTLATICWTGLEPTAERGGRVLRASEFLREARDAQGRRIKLMNVDGREYAWTYDEKGFYIHPANNMAQILGFVYNSYGVELKVVPHGLSAEMLNCIVIAVSMMQGKMFVGLH
ncbi:uncharacterized protein FOMMEDRAFT_30285 [Fomitiporia mediterranea MF3/22]|uniref:uncharacterized protein n=1 Tax=Fomitiporia mediterranea (strain MF3/22) TaxID=694068 RepID=UPI0004409707|nr:uncharacterized protein FOMMEDRAFT_30285 [Fomitiporia mediterranea MF3/22]EJD01646.1 hypothetical protein FOMMEDRAFT_30285 [Fomitiporia mediterranea MF3/22]